VIAHGFAEPRQPARVVVLGSGGFVGTAVSRDLVRAGINHVGIGSKDIDLTEASAVGKLSEILKPDDSVVMLSALTPDRGRDAAALMSNLAMMGHLCRALATTRGAHLVYFSSDAVYSFDTALISEQTVPSPRDLYGAMHLTREIMARVPQMPVLVLRPTGIYGPGDTHNSYGPNRFRRTAQKEGKIQLFGAGEETRDHIHVDDVASITVRCLMRRSTGTLNLATGRSLPFHRVAEIVAAELPNRIEIVATPRANPITHRHFDVTSLVKAFPGIRLTLLGEAG
jgi:UDP-glucose 4-epimerase